MPEQPEAKPADKPRKKLPKTALLIAGVMVVEAGGFLAAMKLFGAGPGDSYGAEGGHYVQGYDPTTQPATAEVEVVRKFKVLNTKSGRAYVYDFDISAMVAGDRLADMQKLITERSGEVADRLSMVIRSADPRELDADDLQSLRMKFKREINAVAGDESLVLRVLIPRAVQMRAE
jgi:flagellar basal body-associated protein FliL